MLQLQDYSSCTLLLFTLYSHMSLMKGYVFLVSQKKRVIRFGALLMCLSRLGDATPVCMHTLTHS